MIEGKSSAEINCVYILPLNSGLAGLPLVDDTPRHPEYRMMNLSTIDLSHMNRSGPSLTAFPIYGHMPSLLNK
jgi:hypothetical protein